MSFIVGFLAHLLGLFNAVGSIATASEISHKIISTGFGVSLIPLTFGALILIISALLWLILRTRIKQVS